MTVKVIVAEISHLLVGNLEPLGSKTERSTPQPCDRFDVFVTGIVVYAATIAAHDDQRAFLLVFTEIGLHVHEARDVARLDRVRNIGHALSSASAILRNSSGSVTP
jgi:hypothetical protein